VNTFSSESLAVVSNQSSLATPRNPYGTSINITTTLTYNVGLDSLQATTTCGAIIKLAYIVIQRWYHIKKKSKSERGL
jgi:hypothetical protein